MEQKRLLMNVCKLYQFRRLVEMALDLAYVTPLNNIFLKGKFIIYNKGLDFSTARRSDLTPFSKLGYQHHLGKLRKYLANFPPFLQLYAASARKH